MAETEEEVEEEPPGPPLAPIHEFIVKDQWGEDVPMSNYAGQVLLIVNVASIGTLTTQNYTELTALHTKYRDKRFEVLAFPCNQFGAMEREDLETIQEFVTTKFNAEFPIFDKVNVNGPQEAPLWTYLKSQQSGGMLGDSIKWNFTKFLVDKLGNVVGRYACTYTPFMIEADIQSCVGVVLPHEVEPEPEPEPAPKGKGKK